MGLTVGDILAVVLSYGPDREWGPLVDSLLQEGVPAGNVLIVHNPSAPGEKPPVPPGIEVLTASHNLGYAAGMNLGIAHQLRRSGELLLLLTHDARLRGGALRRLVAVADGNAAYGVLGPALLLPETGSTFSLGGMTSATGTMRHVKEALPGLGEVATCDWIDGGAMLIRSDLLRRTGGFDERFWSYCEDAELCLRATRLGWSVGVVPDALLEQSPGGSKRPGSWAYLITRNGAAYVRRARGLFGLGCLLTRSGFGVIRDLLRAGARRLGLRDGDPSEPWALAIGAARGAFDFMRGRWGPPPSLPGAGDLRNLSPPPGDDVADGA